MAKTNTKASDQPLQDNSAISTSADPMVIGNDNGLLREVIRALRTIQYGSILLTIHNGQLVEVSKNIRIRKSEPTND